MATTLYIESWRGEVLTTEPILPPTVPVPNPAWSRGMPDDQRTIDVPPRLEAITLAPGPAVSAVQRALAAIVEITETTPHQPRLFAITLG